MTPDETWKLTPWITNWLEGQLGLPPWLTLIFVTPVLVFITIFFLREVLLTALFLFPKVKEYKDLTRRISFNFCILLGIITIGLVWRYRAEWFIETLQPILPQWLGDIRPYIYGLGYTLITTLIFGFILYSANRIFRYSVLKLEVWAKASRGVRFQRAVLLSPYRIRQIAELALRIARFTLYLLTAYFYFPLLLSYFPATEPFADSIMPYIIGPAIQIGEAILSYLPSLITLIFIFLAFKYGLRLIHFVMNALSKGEIKLAGFDPEWADPTYRLIRGGMIIIGVMISYPYLPGAGSEIFKGFSIFVGALVTLGSSGAINNIISGIVLTYTRAFRIGDRVRIGNTIGDVLEKKLFVTRIKTLDNEEVTLPNGMVLGGSILNLSVAARAHQGLAIHVSAGIGYDVDWRKVHELLIDAASKTEHILKVPAPFVLQTDLGDFAVSYTLIAYTDQPKLARTTSSNLRSIILDAFNQEGIEIMTPAVASIRDGNHPAIPANFDPRPFPIPKIQTMKA
jgi:small-conductance mechanosensitive channel